MKIRKAVGILCAVLSVSSMVGGSNGAAADNRWNDHRRPPSHGHNDQHGRGPGWKGPHYEFRDQDRSRLQRYYQRNLTHVDRGHRPRFVPGAYIAAPYRGYITPAPRRVVGYLPPPPRGYAVGYYQGYTVVYDPATFLILNVVDLLAR